MATIGLKDIPILILAGGLGTRLQSVVSDRPKALAPIMDKPFLEIQIELLIKQGATHFVLCVGHFAHQIQDYLGDGNSKGIRIDYSIEDRKLLGTGGAIKMAERFILSHALVLNGDTYFDIQYNILLSEHIERQQDKNVAATIALAQTHEQSQFGSIRLDQTERYLESFSEKSQSSGRAGWVNAGAYVIEPRLLGYMVADTPYSLEKDIFPDVLSKEKLIGAFPTFEAFYDIGTPSGLERFVEYYTRIRG